MQMQIDVFPTVRRRNIKIIIKLLLFLTSYITMQAMKHVNDNKKEFLQYLSFAIDDR
jgi:hypothetical protein